MKRYPFRVPAHLLGTVLISFSLVACMPSGGEGGGDEGNGNEPEASGEGGGGAAMGDVIPSGPSDGEEGPAGGQTLPENEDNGGADDQGGGDGPGDIPPVDTPTPGDSNPGNGNAGGAGALGAACSANADCDSNFCITGLPNGYCSQVCQGDADCGASGSCWNLGQPEQVCLLNCGGNEECRESDGYICDGDSTCFPSGGGGGGGGQGASPGVPVGETVADFSLTNCGTGEQVSMRDYFAGQKAAMFVLTAGWCGACAQWVPQVVDLTNNPDAAGLKAVFVLGENGSRARPSQRECQQYAAGHGVAPENMFMDHDGTDSFRTVFGNMMLYTDGNGAFGLPWNAIVNPADWEYIYSDGGPGGDLNAALTRLLQ